MVSIIAVFWLAVITLGLVGVFRGWAKELLVSFSVILAFFLIVIVEHYAPWLEPIESSAPKISEVESSEPAATMPRPDATTAPAATPTPTKVLPTPTPIPSACLALTKTPTPTKQPTARPTEMLETLMSKGDKDDKPHPVPSANDKRVFWFRVGVLSFIVFLGYQTPKMSAVSARLSSGHSLRDAVVGGIVGLVNGYLIAGSIWYFIDQLHYAFYRWMVPPSVVPGLQEIVNRYIELMPPVLLLQIPAIFFAVAFVFIVVIAAFI